MKGRRRPRPSFAGPGATPTEARGCGPVPANAGSEQTPHRHREFSTGLRPTRMDETDTCFRDSWIAPLAMTGKGQRKPHPVFARSACDEAIQHSSRQDGAPHALAAARAKTTSIRVPECGAVLIWNWARLASTSALVRDRLIPAFSEVLSAGPWVRNGSIAAASSL